MRRIIGVAIMAFILIAGNFVFTSASAGDDSSHDDDGDTLRLLTRTVDSADLDLGTAGPSLGDQFVFTDDVYKKGELVGADHGTCTVLRIEDTDFTVQCVVTLVLDDKGQIAVQGAVTFTEDETAPFTLAITGGTDRFRDATGQVKVREISDTDTLLKVELDD